MLHEPLKMMSESDVKRDDWQYVELFENYARMRAYRIKYREIIRLLAIENNISKSSVERIIRRLSKEC